MSDQIEKRESMGVAPEPRKQAPALRQAAGSSGATPSRFCRSYRITNGHRAAVCGLHLAGISLTQACAIIGVPYDQMRTLLGDWYEKKPKMRRWNWVILAEIKEAWCDVHQKVKTIAERYDTTPRQLNLIASREGWPKRKRKHGPPRRKISRLSMSPEKLRRYWKLSHVLGHKAAESIVAEEFR